MIIDFEIDKELLSEAMKITGIKSKKKTIELALETLIKESTKGYLVPAKLMKDKGKS